MEERDEGRAVSLEERIDQAAIIVQTFLVDLSATFGQDATPGDGEAIGVQVEFGHQLDIAFGMKGGVAGDIGILTCADLFRRVRERVPDGSAFTVRGRAAFDLKGSGGGATEEVGRELGKGHKEKGE